MLVRRSRHLSSHLASSATRSPVERLFAFSPGLFDARGSQPKLIDGTRGPDTRQEHGSTFHTEARPLACREKPCNRPVSVGLSPVPGAPRPWSSVVGSRVPRTAARDGRGAFRRVSIGVSPFPPSARSDERRNRGREGPVQRPDVPVASTVPGSLFVPTPGGGLKPLRRIREAVYVDLPGRRSQESCGAVFDGGGLESTLLGRGREDA